MLFSHRQTAHDWKKDYFIAINERLNSTEFQSKIINCVAVKRFKDKGWKKILHQSAPDSTLMEQ